MHCQEQSLAPRRVNDTSAEELSNSLFEWSFNWKRCKSDSARQQCFNKTVPMSIKKMLWCHQAKSLGGRWRAFKGTRTLIFFCLTNESKSVWKSHQDETECAEWVHRENKAHWTAEAPIIVLNCLNYLLIKNIYSLTKLIRKWNSLQPCHRIPCSRNKLAISKMQRKPHGWFLILLTTQILQRISWYWCF